MDLDKINSMTKYPEILTRHVMAEKGMLSTDVSVGLTPDKLYIATEKVDGTNTRMVFIKNRYDCDYLIGSREEILYAKGDRVYNPQMEIVSNLKERAEDIAKQLVDEDACNGLYTIWGELYGGKMPSAKQYTKDKTVYAYRCFDMMYLDPVDYTNVMKMPVEKISSWRQHGKQPFYSLAKLSQFRTYHSIPAVPVVGMVYGREVPTGIEDSYSFLTNFRTTSAGIDFLGHSEGIVLRSMDGNHTEMVKMRFEDYEKTLGIKNKRR